MNLIVPPGETVEENNAKIKIDFGCGFKKKPGFIGVDKTVHEQIVDQIMDLDLPDLKLPWEDNTVFEIYTAHFLEHIRNLFPFMNECHRILKPLGKMEIIVPSAESAEGFEDPTHIRFFTGGTFHYFTENPPGGYLNPEIKGKWKILLNDWTTVMYEDTEKVVYPKRREHHVILQPVKTV